MTEIPLVSLVLYITKTHDGDWPITIDFNSDYLLSIRFPQLL